MQLMAETGLCSGKHVINAGSNLYRPRVLGKASVTCLEPYNSDLVQTCASCLFAMAVPCMLLIEHGSPDGDALTSWLTAM